MSPAPLWPRASTRHGLGQAVAPSLLLGPSTAQWKRKGTCQGPFGRGPEAKAQLVRAGPALLGRFAFADAQH